MSLPKLILPVLIFLEILFMFCLAGYRDYPQAFTSIGGFLAALAFGVVVLRYRPLWNAEIPLSPGRKRRAAWISIALMALLLVWVALYLKKLFAAVPIDKQYSDVIPSIRILNQRLLHGETVYRPIEEFGYHFEITYLPLHWLPYLIAGVLHWDERWTAFVIFAIAAVLVVRTVARAAGLGYGILTALLIAVMLYWIAHFFPEVFSKSVEVMIAGYYALFILALGRGNRWLLAGAMLLCLLSRYSLVLWLPLWAAAVFFRGNRKNFLVTAGLVAAGVLVIYVIPFLSKDWSALSKAYGAYSGATLGEWQHMNEHGQPMSLYAGSGAAWYFYSHFQSLPLAVRLHLLQQVHLVLCLGSVAVLALWYFRRRRGRPPLTVFLLGSFKIYLAVFLMFIQLPYIYLMITGPMVSLAIWAALARWRTVPALHRPSIA